MKPKQLKALRVAATRTPGRPSINGTPMSNAERLERSLAGLRDLGGWYGSVRLSPESHEAAQRIQRELGLRSNRAVIEVALLYAAQPGHMQAMRLLVGGDT